MNALLLSFGIIFVAELGDKSQLMALAFAARYKALPILIGITGATAVVHLLSVIVGAVVGRALPTRPLAIVAGLAFLAFAGWTLRGDHLDEDEAARADARAVRRPGGGGRLLPGRARRQDHARDDHAGHHRRLRGDLGRLDAGDGRRRRPRHPRRAAARPSPP